MILLILTSFNGKYPEPIWYEIDFNDGVIHKWSREVYDDYFGVTSGQVTKEQQKVNKKFKHVSKRELEYRSSWSAYIESKKKRKDKMKSILNEIHF